MSFYRLNSILAFFFMAALIFSGSAFWLPENARAQDITPEIKSSTQNVIRDQIRAFQNGQHERAFSHAAESIRQIFKNTDQFINMVKGGYMPLYDPENYSFGRNLNVDGLVHQEVIATDQKGRQWQAVYTLKQNEDGSWKITGVKMEPYQGAST